MSDHIYPNNTPIILLNCKDAFNELTEKEKLYAHYLSKASWYGGLVILFQTSPESPLIYLLLHKLFETQTVSDIKEIALNDCGFTEDEFTAFMVYTSGIFFSMGNYKSRGDCKFVPNLPQEKFKKLIFSSKLYKENPGDVDRLFSKCSDSIYSLKDNHLRLGLSPNGISTYFSSNVTSGDLEIVKKFLKEKNVEAWNSRLFKEIDESGKSCYEIRTASALSPGDSEDNSEISTHTVNSHKFALSRGDYSPILEVVNKYLSHAMKYAANEHEVKMIENYIKSFRTGSVDAHKDGSRHWIKDKGPVIESYIGFIETYRDPDGVRGEFEGFVAMVNKTMSAKFINLVSSAESFLPLLPWPTTYNMDQFLRPDFTSLDLLTFASSDVPAGICIPNYNEIKQTEGFKNVSLGNVLSIRGKEPPNYLSKENQDLVLEYISKAFELNVGLHELLGHGSGKLFKRDKSGKFNFDPETTMDLDTDKKITSWYEEGETFTSVFGSTGSAYEECRAECVALHLSDNTEVLKIFGFEGEKAETITYVLWLGMLLSGIEGLQMYSTKTEKWLQAHAHARFVILNVLLESGNDFVKVEQVDGADGKPDLLLSLDRSKLSSVGKTAIGNFLRKLQLYRSTANITKGKAMFDKYSAVKPDGPHPFLKYREIVMARKKPLKVFVQANTSIVDGKVQLKNYDASPEGMIQSWIDRFQECNVDSFLEQLYDKDKGHFCFE